VIRVLLTANAIYLPGGSLSGGDKRFIEIFKRIAAGGQFQVELMTAREGAEAAHREGMGNIAIHMLPSLAAQSPIGLAFDYAMRTLSAIGFIAGLRTKYDLIYSTTDVLTDILPAFLLRTFGRPKPGWVAVVFHLIPSPSRRSGSSIGNWLSYWQQRMCHALMKHANLIVVDNSLVKQGLIARGLNESRIIVAPAGGVDLPRMESAKPSEEKFDALFVGRLHPAKGIFDLPEIWAKACEQMPGLRLGIVGNGPAHYRTALADALAVAGLSGQAVLLGSPETDRLYGLLKSARLFISPSHEEGWGIAICEAMACGLPVVAYDLPVYAEVFGGAVQTVTLNDRAGFVEKILELFSNPMLRQSVVEQSLAVACQYSWENVTKLEEELLLAVALGDQSKLQKAFSTKR